MVTIYDLLEVSENASKEEITKAYQNMIMEYRTDPALSEKENSENEMILNKMKIAYEILANDEKRKRYDSDIAKKRAEELIQNVATADKIEESEDINSNGNVQDNKEDDDSRFYDNTEEDIDLVPKENVKKNDDENIVKNKVPMTEEERRKHEKDVENALKEPILSKKEQKELKKAAQEEFKKNLQKAEQAEKEYNDAYNKAYNDYLKKNGYTTSQESYGLLYKIKNISIVVIAVLIVCVIAWIIPPIRNTLISVYEENYIVKAIVDIFIAIIKAIFSIFK